MHLALPLPPLAVEEDGVVVPEIARLPPIGLEQVLWALGVALAGWLLARLVRLSLLHVLRRRRSASYARVFSRLASVVVAALGFAAALTIAFPSVRPVDVLGGLGIVSIAVGIAFQSVLGNLFAGILILVREPFTAGDQIGVGDIRGTVEGVNLRETVVRTFDGRRVLVPNSTVYGEILTVQTGYEQIRTSVILGVDYATDLARAREVAVEAARSVDGVIDFPAPDCLLCELAASTINFELRFWSGARQLDAVETRDRVIEAVTDAFAREGIEMPADVRVLQAAPSLGAALQGRPVTPGGGVVPDAAPRRT